MNWTDTPRTWVAGEELTAALLNAEVRDRFAAFGNGWTTYSPSWTASANPAIGDGTLTGAYRQAGKDVEFRIELTIGSTTTFGTGAWRFSLPVTSESSSAILPIGVVFGVDTSASASSTGAAILRSATTISANLGASGQAAPTTPWTWATGDTLGISGSYEAA